MNKQENFYKKYNINNLEIIGKEISDKETAYIDVMISSLEIENSLNNLRNSLKNFKPFKEKKIVLNIFAPEDIMKNETIKFINLLIKQKKMENSNINYFFKDYFIEMEDNTIKLSFAPKTEKNILETVKIIPEIHALLKGILQTKKFKVYIDDIELNPENSEKEKKVSENEEATKIKRKKKKEVPMTQLISFKDLTQSKEGHAVALEGKIFNMEFKTTKKGSLMYNFMITDYTDSISCQMFAETDEPVSVKKGTWVKVTGYYEFDKFNNENHIRTLEVVEIPSKDIQKKDNSPVKRIELHAHTQMSEMSGVMSVENYLKRAKEYGHPAAAVTDISVVHSYPFAFKQNDENFKAILGMEAYVVDDEQDIITNATGTRIEDAVYTVFDIETTGFSPFNDKIIEIGAVKMKGKEIIDTFSTFVNPEIPIPENIVELTSITDFMVQDSETIEKVLPEFLEFCKDTVLVAHNAKFDIGFITQKAKELSLEFQPGSIDTLPLAKILIPDLKGFGLAKIVMHYDIKLDNHHRAVDDAQATAEILQKFINQILSKGIYTLKEINEQLQPNIQNAETKNVIILVKNQKGLKALYELVSRSHVEFFGKKRPRIPKSLLNSMRKNLLLCSSATLSERNAGELVNLYTHGTDLKEIEEKADYYDYFEIQPVSNYADLEKEISVSEIHKMNKYFYNLAKKLNKPIVATGDAHYLEEREFLNRNVLLMGGGNLWKTETENGKEYKIYDRKLYFRTTEEMLEEFKYLGEEIAYEVVVENTHVINSLIEKVRPIPEGFFPPEIEGAEDEVREITYKKLEELYGKNIDISLKERVEKELNAIINNGFAVLYLTAQKLVKKSVDAGYLVGSRGSVGSSIVAYLMGITEVNGLYPHYRCSKCKHTEFMNEEGSGVDYPDKNCPECGTKYIKDGHAIPFEVFMGFDGDKVPDIDLNFSGEYQGEIHKYTEELFGSENVFRAGTISTLAEKNAFGYVKKYLEAIEDTTEIKERRAEVMRMAKGCEGARKTTGQHPGGMVVIPRNKSIYDFCPVQRPANDMKSNSLITHFDYHVMDEQLVKLDILGHDDPTMLKNLGDLTGIDIYKLPLDDKNVLSLFSGTEVLGVTPEEIGCPLGTSGIPEFGTTFVKQMLIDTRPKTFAELVRISGLSHGTDVWLNNAQDYVREGTATLSEIISVRDDIMNRLIDDGLDKSLAFSIMEFVRKGQPTKNPEKWKEYSALMKEKGVKQWYIDSCEKIKYMFPKAHATAYVIMGVRIAYFKVYYPLEFYTAFLNRKTDAFKISTMFRPVAELKKAKVQLEAKQSLNVKEKQELFLYEILIEMYYRGIELEMVDIYKSDAQKFIIDNGKIRMPLSAVDGLGENVAIAIEKERSVHEFSSVEDLKRRTKITKTVISIMDMFDCFDKMEETDQMTLF